MRQGFSMGQSAKYSGWLLAGLLASGAPAQAADPQRYNDFEITPFAGYMFGGEFEDSQTNDELDLASDLNFGVIFNAAADEWRHYELIYSRQSTDVEGDTAFEMDVQYLQIGGIVSYPDGGRVIPYFGLTVGAAEFSPDASGLDSETELSFSIAGGLRAPITEHIGVRFDARAFVTLLDGESEIFCVSSGGATCRVRASSDTFLQYAATLGVTIGF